MKLWVKVLIAIGLGVIAGCALGDKAEALKPIGTVFINLLNMLIVPLVFSSMVMGVVSSPDTKKLGRVGGLSIVLYAITTIIAIITGITLAYALGLGNDLHLNTVVVANETHDLPHIKELLLSIIPKNPFHAFAEGNIMQIIIFSILFGFALKLSGDVAKPVISVINSLSHVMLRFTHMVMAVSPIGVFALMCWATGSFGLEVLMPVGKFLMSYYLGCLFFFVCIIAGGIVLLTRLSPLPFFKGLTEAFAMSASTCSSSATLPITIQCCHEKLGISQAMSQFLLPLGASLNMNGSSLFQTMSAIFIANAYGIELEWEHLMILSTTVILASVGTASIPGGGLLMLSIVFSSIGIPLEGIAILAGIDRLRDMATTTLNITSDAACALIVANKEGDLDTSVYYKGHPLKHSAHELTSL